MNVHTKNESSILYRGRENHVPPKPDIHKDRHTYRRTDISVYRVASLLSIVNVKVGPTTAMPDMVSEG